MKLKNIAIVAAAAALAVGMTACGSSASSTAASSSVASSAAASSEAASSEAASSEAAEPTTAEYTVYNTTGSTVTELYLYDAGSDEKGDNLAGGENIVITRDVEADKQSDVTYILEFTTEDGQTQSFETLHYEVAPISLLSVDAAAGATPIAFTAPEK